MYDRSDTTWSEQGSPQDRLRWVRSRLRNMTQEDFAKSLGMKRGAYRLYEEPDYRRHSNVDYDLANLVERKHKVRWQWLFKGEGEPWLEDQQRSSPADRAARLVDELPDEEREAFVAALETMARRKAG